MSLLFYRHRRVARLPHNFNPKHPIIVYSIAPSRLYGLGTTHKGGFRHFPAPRSVIYRNASTIAIKLINHYKQTINFRPLSLHFASHILFRPRRKLQIPLEALFMIDFPTAKHKFSFFLDRKNKKVTIDINSGARVYSKHFNVESMQEDSTIRSLALVFQQKQVTLFLDCKKIGSQDLEVDISRLYSGMDDPVLKLVRSELNISVSSTYFSTCNKIPSSERESIHSTST